MTPPRRRRRRGRRIIGWILLPLAVLGGLYALAAAYVPQAIDAAISRSIAQQLGSPANVNLSPGPIWQVAFGRFDRLEIRMPHLTYQGLNVSAASLDWRDGQVDLAALQRGRLVIVRKGTLVVAGTIGSKVIEQALADAVRPYLPSGSTVTVPQVSIAPQGISIGGAVDVLGVPIPYRLEGVLEVASGGKRIVFQTRSLNRSALALPAVPVMKAQQIPQVDGISWRFARVTLQKGSVAVSLKNGP